MSKTDLKVYHVPFKSTVSGTISVLATSPEGAAAHLNTKLEDGSLGWDKENLAEEGVLHDGSISFESIQAGEIESAGDPVETKEDPTEHNDWEAFEENDNDVESDEDTNGRTA